MRPLNFHPSTKSFKFHTSFLSSCFGLFSLLATYTVQAQGTPQLEWQKSHAPRLKPQGSAAALDHWNGNTSVYALTAATSQVQTRETSGSDWWNFHCNLPDGGYVAVGYSNFVNWKADYGCGLTEVTYDETNQYEHINYFRMERYDRRTMDVRQSIARFNAQGDTLWFKTFGGGVFTDVVLDHNGDLVVSGTTFDLRTAEGFPSYPMYFNPTATSPTTDLSANQCDPRSRLMNVVKFDLDGTVKWNHLYSNFDVPATAIIKGTEGYSLIETHIDNAYGYRIVGYGTVDVTNQKRLFEVDLNEGGLINWKTLHSTVPGGTTSENFDTRGERIVRTPMNIGEYYAIVGYRFLSNSHSSAFLWVKHDDVPLFFKDTQENTEFAAKHDPILDQNSNGACFQITDGVPAVVWPIMADFTTSGNAANRGYTYASNHQANAFVYKFKLDGTAPVAWTQPADLGVLRGFDLHFTVTPTMDGNLALASTKWSSPNATPSPLFGWSDLPASVQNYLNVDPNGMAYDVNGPNNSDPVGEFFDWQNFKWAGTGAITTISSSSYVYGYWNTDSYVAKLNGTTGAVIWQKLWDEGTGASATGWPGNFRRRQCNFNITEANDGGFVVSGNEGSNFDDSYLAKLDPCVHQITGVVGPVCQPDVDDGSIDVSVTGGTGPFTYQWSTGASTEDLSTLAPGTYTVTVTDQGDAGCAESSLFTIAEPMTVTVTSVPGCLEGNYPDNAIIYTVAVTAGGVGPFSYTWYGYVDPDGGPLSAIHYGSQYVFIPGTTLYPYDVSALDQSTGCVVGPNEPYLTSWPDPTLITAVVTPAACTAATTGSIDITLPPEFGPATFLWSTTATTEDISMVGPGVYSVTATFGQSCTLTRSITVEDIAPCCPADLLILDGALSSSYGTSLFTSFSNTSLNIAGIFYVDNDLLIVNSTVYMEPGAEIVVQPGASLRMGGCTVGSCKDIMWSTITAKNNSYVQIDACTVRDAENVITAMNGSALTLKNSQFNDNRVTLYIPAINGVPFNSVATSVMNNSFLSTGTLAQPYPGQTTAVGDVGYAAVDVNKTTIDLTGGGNVIDGMSYGLVGTNSSLDVSGFTIKNIQPDNAYGAGAGIYVRGQAGFFGLTQVGNGQNGTPSFENCTYGVVTDYMNVSSTDNRMENVGIGYKVSHGANRTAQILTNQINANYYGMDLRMNGGATQFLVQYNSISFGNLDNGPYPFCFGIFVNEAREVNPDSRIVNNYILFKPHYASRIGVGLLSAGKWLVADNSLDMVDNLNNRLGIATDGSRDPEISCNQITGASSTFFPNSTQAAISNSMGTFPLISCNVVDKTANGILFNGVVTGTTLLRGNEMMHHKWGLHLAGSPSIGTQDLHGNLWFNPPAAGGLGALCESNAFLSQFFYNPAIIGGGSTQPPTVSPITGWFNNIDGTNYDCANDPEQNGNYCSQFYAVQRSAELNYLDQKIATDSLENDPYTEETKWMLKGGLYKKLAENPNLRDSLPDMAAFYNDLQGSTIAAFKAVDDSQLALYDLDSSVVLQLHANHEDIHLNMGLVKDQMALLDNDQLTAVQRNAIMATINGYRQNIETLTAWNTTALDVARNSKVLSADGIKAANEVIGTTELIETNQKITNKIYLEVIAKEVDHFTMDQTSSLFAIADQCPMVGGNAVFEARSMYRLIDDTYIFDDPQLCLQHGILVKNLKPMDETLATVIPNPAKDEATLVLEKPLEEPGTFVLYNVVGAEVMRMAVTLDEQRTPFSTGSLAPGMYHYTVIVSTGTVGQGKWSIVR